MYRFSDRSQAHLATCDQRLQDLFNEVIKYVDCSIIEGHRNREKQDEVYRQRLSKVRWPNSKHNLSPSRAVDVAPWPIDWRDTARFTFFGGIVMGIALKQGIKIRWGGDWSGDMSPSDETFLDYVHYELID
jgi:peptidoglycan L-alanyl-D-glutamate endopeptidase CwlK